MFQIIFESDIMQRSEKKSENTERTEVEVHGPKNKKKHLGVKVTPA